MGLVSCIVVSCIVLPDPSPRLVGLTAAMERDNRAALIGME
ncbi:hypothetical protein [Paenibacillus lycopersici]|nr:hypothetical protein [Paenibacillus lycopersici]